MIQPLFISVDPQRDSVKGIREYLKGNLNFVLGFFFSKLSGFEDFHPRMIGLTGTPTQIERVSKYFRVYFSKPKQSDQEDDYLVDHSIILYLLDPEGKFVDFFGTISSDKDIVDRLRSRIYEYFKNIKEQK